MYYAFTLVFLIALYILGVLLLPKINVHKNYINFVFATIIAVIYVYCVITIYKSVGVNDWNFTNTLPSANVSPFTYTLLIISFVFPKKIRYYVFYLVSLLSFAMFCAGVISCVSYIARDYAFHLNIAMDALIHVILSLYGVYIVKSGQVDLNNKKDTIVSGVSLLAVAFMMLVINLIFDTAFFGLSMYGKHSIYNMVLFDNGITNALVYFAGLTVLLFVGYYFQLLLNKRKLLK